MSVDQQDALFDVGRVPLSFFGSWMSILVAGDEEELFLRNHHGGANNLFPLSVLANGEVTTPEITARPWSLALKAARGQVEICFENASTVRMRGAGVGFRIGKKELMYSCGSDLFAINKPPTRRYQVEVMCGSGKLHQLVPTQPVYPKVLEIVPDDDGSWEIAIDEFESTWVPRERAGFDECLTSAKEAFNKFLDAMPPVRQQDRAAQGLAAYVNWATAVGECGLVRRPSLLMSKNRMSNIWSWDHCFNAMALAKGHPKLAIDQMLTMVDHQDEFGCYPDSFNDRGITFNFSKPPVHGWAFGEMLARMAEAPRPETVRVMYEALCAQAKWWMTHRVLEGSRLPYYLHGNDSGWDNSTMFKQGVPLEAPDLAALLVLQMETCADLAERLGEAGEAEGWKKRADELFGNLMKELWRGDRFVACLGNEGRDVESQSLIPWLPIILGRRLSGDVRESLRKGIEGHLTEWGLATEQVESPRYNEDGYWRGPIWAPSTFIAVTGLDRAGFSDLADDISERFCRMCAKSGFAENFNALTGEPLRCPAYTWTSSVFLLLARRMARREK